MTTLGVIGLGRIGAFHTETLTSLPGLDGLVITDERTDVAKAVAAKYGATAVTRSRSCCPPAWTASWSPPPRPAHAALTLAAVERGMPTFCEKPIAVDRRGERPRRRGHRALRRAGADRLPAPVRRRVRRRQARRRRGSLGSLHTVRSTTMDPAPPPLDYIKGSGGIFRDCAVHDFDVLRWITGQNAVEVYATGTVQGDPLFTEYGDVDTAAVVVTFDGGALGVVSNARYNARGYDCRLEVHGFDDSVVAGWDQGVPVRNMDPANDFPDRAAAPLLHGPLHRGVPHRAGRRSSR